MDGVSGVVASDGGVCISMLSAGEAGGVDRLVSAEVKHCAVSGGVEVMVLGVVAKEGGVNDNGENAGFRCTISSEEVGAGVDVAEGIVAGCSVVASCSGRVCAQFRHFACNHLFSNISMMRMVIKIDHTNIPNKIKKKKPKISFNNTRPTHLS